MKKLMRLIIIIIIAYSCSKENPRVNSLNISNSSIDNITPVLYPKPLSGFVCTCSPDVRHYTVTLQTSGMSERKPTMWLVFSLDELHVSNFVAVPDSNGFPKVTIYHSGPCGAGALYCTWPSVPVIGDTVRDIECHNLKPACFDCSLCK